MTLGGKPAAAPPAAPAPAARGEHWWPVALAIVVAAFLHVALPAKYRVDPAWVVPAVLLALLAALIMGDPGRIDRQKTWLRIVTGAVIAFLTVANLLAAVHLFHDILTNNKLFASNATGLLATGGVLWATNVIAFGLWYWDLDRGGAAARAHHPQADPAFIFPEMLHTQYVPATWVPKFVDYLSLGFWTATAFSPTDISAIKPWAKLLMITEAAASLGIAGLVIARAINILAYGRQSPPAGMLGIKTGVSGMHACSARPAKAYIRAGRRIGGGTWLQILRHPDHPTSAGSCFARRGRRPISGRAAGQGGSLPASRSGAPAARGDDDAVAAVMSSSIRASRRSSSASVTSGAGSACGPGWAWPGPCVTKLDATCAVTTARVSRPMPITKHAVTRPGAVTGV